MAGNRKNQSAAIRFGPALKAAFLCLLIAGSAVGYVWQKSQIYQLGLQIRQHESQLMKMRKENQELRDQIAFLQLPGNLDRHARELGLAPAQPNQVWRLPEPSAPPGNVNLARPIAARQADATTE
jgi:cell division protein FtsL